MAQIRFSNLVNDIRGAVGGVTFSRSASGATVSARKSRRRAHRSRSGSGRAPLIAAAQHWRTLSDSQRGSWIEAARDIPMANKLGIPRSGSGFELFCKASAIRIRFGLPIIPEFTPYWGSTLFSVDITSFRLSDNRLLQVPASTAVVPAASISFISPVQPSPYPAPRSSAYQFSSSAAVNLWDRVSYSAPQFVSTQPAIATSPGQYFWLRQYVILQDYNWPLFFTEQPVLIIP